MMGCFLQVIDDLGNHADAVAVAHIVMSAVEGATTTWCDASEKVTFYPDDVEQARIMPIPVEVPEGQIVFAHQALEPGALLGDGRTLPLCAACRKAAKL